MESIIYNTINVVIAACVGYLVTCLRKYREDAKNLERDNEILKQGFQAMLRAQMIAEYNRFSEKGYAPIWSKDSFEALYAAYHRCGANGVMTDIYTRFMALPTTPKEDK